MIYVHMLGYFDSSGSFDVQELLQLTGLQRVRSGVLRGVSRPPDFFTECIWVLFCCGLGRLCLRSFKRFFQFLVILLNFCFSVFFGLDSGLMGFDFCIFAVNSGPAVLFGYEEKTAEPGIILSHSFSINLFNYLTSVLRRSRSLLILYSSSTASELSLLSS